MTGLHGPAENDFTGDGAPHRAPDPEGTYVYRFASLMPYLRADDYEVKRTIFAISDERYSPGFSDFRKLNDRLQNLIEDLL